MPVAIRKLPAAEILAFYGHRHVNLSWGPVDFVLLPEFSRCFLL